MYSRRGSMTTNDIFAEVATNFGLLKKFDSLLATHKENFKLWLVPDYRNIFVSNLYK